MPIRVDRRCLLTIAAALAFSRHADAVHRDKSRLQQIASRLAQFLRQAQRSDGSWRSDTYGLLRSGQSVTPFVLLSLLQADADWRHSDRAGAALGWMRGKLRDGCLGIAEPDVLDYPVYSTSLALRCFLHCDLHRSSVDSMRDYLLSEQYAEHRGFRPEDLAYGGWGFGGEHPPGKTGHMDLAHTRWVLQALRESGLSSDPCWARSLRLLRLLQKHPDEDRGQPLDAHRVSSNAPFDGGFYFSPIVLSANKGRLDSEQGNAFFRSYATATCDGILALLAAGVERDDPRVVAAEQWLSRHSDWSYPYGIPRDYPEPWGEAVYFYHQACRAEVSQALDVRSDWRGPIADRLAEGMDRGGAVVNPNGLMKENDPILCTALALRATTAAIKES